MTALNFLIQEKQVCFAIDTLAVTADEKQPLCFMTKFIVLPHLSTAVAGTGHAELITQWMNFIRSSLVARDVEHLNQYVPDNLKKLAENFPELDDITATIYHFGFSNYRQAYIGYAYRSTNGWISEELSYDGIGIKPVIKVDLRECFQLPEKFIEIMKNQQEEDNKLPPKERVGIGGEIHFVHMADGLINISICHRFDNYESDYERICAGIQTE